MRKRVLGLSLCAMLFALCSHTEAQQPTKILRIGFLNGGTAFSIAGLLDAFRHIRDVWCCGSGTAPASRTTDKV
jgi:hypothetical protein